MSSPFTRFPLTICCHSDFVPKPSYHHTNANCIILSTCYAEIHTKPQGIYKYNMETLECELLHEYAKLSSNPVGHGQFIDPSNDTLILFGGYKSWNKTFKIFDLKTNVMQELRLTNMLSECCMPTATYVPPPVNRIHVLDNNKHYKYIAHNHTIELNLCCQLKTKTHGLTHLLYIPSKKKLMIFGSEGDNKIFDCDVEPHSHQTDYQWNINTLTMPWEVNHGYYDILLGFTAILFVFDFSKQNIYLLDVLNDRWFKSEYSLPDSLRHSYTNCYVMKCHDNAHILDFFGRNHFKVCLYDLIPNELIISNQHYSKLLIMGYVREKENDLSMRKIPFALKVMILNYFGLF